MGVKFRLFALFLLLALIAGIESRPRSGGGRRTGGSCDGGRCRTTNTSRPTNTSHPTYRASPPHTLRRTNTSLPTNRSRPPSVPNVIHCPTSRRPVTEDPRQGAPSPGRKHDIQKPPLPRFIIPHENQPTETKPPTVSGHHVYPTQPPVNPHANRRPVYPNGRNSSIGSPGYSPHGINNGTRPGFEVPSAPGNDSIAHTFGIPFLSYLAVL